MKILLPQLAELRLPVHQGELGSRGVAVEGLSVL